MERTPVGRAPTDGLAQHLSPVARAQASGESSRHVIAQVRTSSTLKGSHRQVECSKQSILLVNVE
jgi:hypothetical protein